MGCFTIHDDEGRHVHEGDFIRVSTRGAIPVLVAVGHYDSYGWVYEYPPVGVDVFSATMMLEAGLIPHQTVRYDTASSFRSKFFDNFHENMSKITKYLQFEGFSGLDSECRGCQSIFLEEAV